MPEIPLYTGGGAPNASTNFGARMEGNLLTGVGDVLQDSSQRGLGAYLEQRKDERDKLQSLKMLADWKIRWTEDLKRRDQEQEGPDGFTPGVMDAYDVDLDKMLDAAPSEGARTFLAAKAQEYRVEVYNDALRIETGKDVAARSKVVSEITSKAANFANTSPKNGPDAIQMAVSGVRNSGLPSQMKPEAEQQAVWTVGRSWVEGMARARGVGPEQTLQRLRDGQFDNILSPSDRRVLEDKLETDIKQGQAQSNEERNRTRIRWARGFEDKKAWWANGNAPTAEDMATYSDEYIDSLFPDDPEAAAASKKERDVAQSVGKVMADPAATLPDLRQKAAKERAKIEGGDTSATSYREADQRVGQLESAINRREAALKEDGGGYVQEDPVVQSVTEQIQQLESEKSTLNDPSQIDVIDRQLNALYDEWLARTYEAQLKNGLRQPAAPKSFIETTAETINRLEPGKIPEEMQKLRERFPSSWHRIAGEIQSKLQTKTRALFLLSPSKTSKMLADSHKLSNEELLQGMPDDRKQTLMDLFKSDRTMQDALRAMRPLANGTDVAEALQDATLRGAALYMKTDGLDPTSAWRKAREDVLQDNTTAYIGGRPYLIPRKVVGTPETQEKIESGAYRARTDFKVGENIWLPPGLPGIVGKRITHDVYQNYIRREGYFVGAGDDSGLILYANGNPVHYIENGKQKLVVYTWSDLAKMGQYAIDVKKRRPPGGYAYGKGRME